MPFSSLISDARLVQEYLVVKYQNERGQLIPLTLNLNSCLGSASGKFHWGGTQGVSLAKNLTLVNGSVLKGNLQRNGQLNPAQIDLGTNIDVKDGRLVYISSEQRGHASPRAPRFVSPPSSSPPLYPENDQYSYGFCGVKSSANSTASYDKQSSYDFKCGVGNTVESRGSVLHAQGQRLREKVHSGLQWDFNPDDLHVEHSAFIRTGQLKSAQVDLGTNTDGRLVYIFEQREQVSPRVPMCMSPPSSPPTVYAENDQYSYGFCGVKSTMNSTASYAKQSSYESKCGVGNTVESRGSALHANGRKSGEVHSASFQWEF
ncbi:hypothetical protein BDP27DRAFT_1369706 [Rhodocollybia butyracea]|uniref:Cyanovirin-N domain-containing protein n=1 Tax=Rhodocollybia butyracea TaxID=206335 RepID=A0A9P5PCK5_9AGAR|nr:hypothetical protein BDP27DRAFT_1369706 [Rhodocollybia butyracea]